MTEIAPDAPEPIRILKDPHAVREAKPGDLLPPSRSVDPVLEDGDETGIPDQEEFFRSPARFGSIPVEAFPLGWDRRLKFNKLYPFVSLPTQVVERVSFGNPKLEPNRLFWGDNLHVMRQLPTESIDLIYIDPPFFSGRKFNVIFGDQNEVRSFSDIWDGGMPGYLEWLNARLFEMKRMLSPHGSIFLHLDWHAVHYAKAECDKLFGSTSFRNEIVWYYENKLGTGGQVFDRRHDVLLVYGKSRVTFHNELTIDIKNPKMQPVTQKIGGKRIWLRDEHGERRYEMSGTTRPLGDVWSVPIINPVANERIGYPTQKPEALLEKVIQAAVPVGGVVADFFVGGGTTAAVAQRLGRRWIACDQSRVAVAVTADRLAKQAEQGMLQNMTGGGRPRFHNRTLGHIRGRTALAGAAGPVPSLHRRLCPVA